jgi:hypothetical protein
MATTSEGMASEGMGIPLSDNNQIKEYHQRRHGHPTSAAMDCTEFVLATMPPHLAVARVSGLYAVLTPVGTGFGLWAIWGSGGVPRRLPFSVEARHLPLGGWGDALGEFPGSGVVQIC